MNVNFTCHHDPISCDAACRGESRTAYLQCQQLIEGWGEPSGTMSDEQLSPQYAALDCGRVLLRGSGSSAQILVDGMRDGSGDDERMSIRDFTSSLQAHHAKDAPRDNGGKALAAICRDLLEQMDSQSEGHRSREALERRFESSNCPKIMLQGSQEGIATVLVK
jgi:hypothetical protein